MDGHAGNGCHGDDVWIERRVCVRFAVQCCDGLRPGYWVRVNEIQRWCVRGDGASSKVILAMKWLDKSLWHSLVMGAWRLISGSRFVLGAKVSSGGTVG